MTRRSTRSTLACALVALLVTVGCGSDTTDPVTTPPSDFSGIWNVNLEVTSKRTCEATVGQQYSRQWTLTQQNGQATLVFDPFTPILIPLTVRGGRATGSTTADFYGLIEVDFTLTDGEMGGTFSFTRTDPVCTEVASVTGGTRINTSPSSNFAGNWELDVEVDFSFCDGEPSGSVDRICRNISVNGNTVIIDDVDGPIRGVGDGNTATLRRFTEEEIVTVNLTVSGGTVTGDVDVDDRVNQCSVESTVTGTRLAGACPPPPSPADFAGSWFVQVGRFSQSGASGGTRASTSASASKSRSTDPVSRSTMERAVVFSPAPSPTTRRSLPAWTPTASTTSVWRSRTAS